MGPLAINSTGVVATAIVLGLSTLDILERKLKSITYSVRSAIHIITNIFRVLLSTLCVVGHPEGDLISNLQILDVAHKLTKLEENEGLQGPDSMDSLAGVVA